jgi:hypothetical protein
MPNTLCTRAKFKVDSITITRQTIYPHKTGDGETIDYTRPEKVEMRTLSASPVYSNDPNNENAKFWAASPNGSFTLGTVNAEAVKGFEPETEFYIDLTIA